MGVGFFVSNIVFGYLWDNFSLLISVLYSISFAFAAIIGMLALAAIAKVMEKSSCYIITDMARVMMTTKTLFFVEADAGRITQVISNLLNNAIKFTKLEAAGEAKDNTIAIIADKNKDDKAIVVSVEDTGSGIDPKIFPKLFSKFATNSDSGTGLGLFISKNIVEAHGGKIWAENNTDGFGKRTRGAKFCFTLPITDKLTNRSMKTKSDAINRQGITRI